MVRRVWLLAAIAAVLVALGAPFVDVTRSVSVGRLVPVTAAFVGDSYTVGVGASVPSKRFSSLIAGARGWTEVNLAVGGTGYLPAVPPMGLSYTERIPDVAAANPGYVLINGGRNDVTLGASQVWADGVKAYFMSLRAAVPHARIVATAPIWDDDPVPANLWTMRRVVRQAVTAVGGQYADLGDPLLGSPAMVAADSVHPSDTGHAAIAAAFAAAFTANVPTGPAWFSSEGGFGHDCALHQAVDHRWWSPWCGGFQPVTVAIGMS